MCGLAGIVLGRKRRRQTELDEIGRVITHLLVLNQARGKDAAGIAVVRKDGDYRLLKRSGPALNLIKRPEYGKLILSLDNKVTAILGHTRLATRGSEKNSLNNHPLRAGRCIGCHNGTLLNANYLTKKLRLPRVGEVDSEVLFRIADKARDEAHFLRLLKRCRGQITATFVWLDEPCQVYLLKGNRPLCVAHVPRWRAVVWASQKWMLAEALREHKWRELEVDPMTLSTFTAGSDDILDFSSKDATFNAEEKLCKKLTRSFHTALFGLGSETTRASARTR